MRCPYTVLGVSRTASQSEIRIAYLHLLQIHHPDHSSDPRASSMTAEIVSAYAVLGDPAKRASYDAEQAMPDPAQPGFKEAARSPLPEVTCIRCGVQNSTLRSAIFYWVMSFVIVTQRHTRTAVWCDKCRFKEAVKWSLISGGIGWFGFPWGPIYACQAMFHNAAGGKKNTEVCTLRKPNKKLVIIVLQAEGNTACRKY